MLRSLILAALCGASLLAQFPAVQAAPTDDLLVSVPGKEPTHFARADLAALATREIDVEDEKGQPAHYRGVSIAAVLGAAGWPLPPLRGKLLLATLRVSAADGYAVVFALPELDPAFTAAEALVCFERDGGALSDQEGPFRVVVPGEKRHARWVRRVVELLVQPGADHEN